MRKSAVAILISIIIVILSVLGAGGYFIYNHFFASNEEKQGKDKEYIVTKGPSLADIKGIPITLGTDALQSTSTLSYSFSKGFLLKGPIGNSIDMLYGFENDQELLIKSLQKENAKSEKKQSDKAALEQFYKDKYTYIIPVKITNPTDYPQYMEYFSLVDSEKTVAKMQNVYTIDRSPSDVDEKTKLRYDFYLTGDLSLGNLSKEELELKAIENYTSIQGAINKKAAKELHLVDTTTMLLPHETREGNLVFVSTHRDMPKTLSLKLEEKTYPMQMGTEEIASSLDSVVVKTNAEDAKAEVKENALHDLYLSFPAKFKASMINTPDLKIEVKDARYYSEPVAKPSYLASTLGNALGILEPTSLFAVKVKATAKKDNVAIDGTFTVNKENVPTYLIGREQGEILPDYQSRYDLFVFRGIDRNTETIMTDEKADKPTQSTIQPTMKKGDVEEGYIYVTAPTDYLHTNKEIVLKYK